MSPLLFVYLCFCFLSIFYKSLSGKKWLFFGSLHEENNRCDWTYFFMLYTANSSLWSVGDNILLFISPIRIFAVSLRDTIICWTGIRCYYVPFSQGFWRIEIWADRCDRHISLAPFDGRTTGKEIVNCHLGL